MPRDMLAQTRRSLHLSYHLLCCLGLATVLTVAALPAFATCVGIWLASRAGDLLRHRSSPRPSIVELRQLVTVPDNARHAGLDLPGAQPDPWQRDFAFDWDNDDQSPHRAV